MSRAAAYWATCVAVALLLFATVTVIALLAALPTSGNGAFVLFAGISGICTGYTIARIAHGAASWVTAGHTPEEATR